MQLLLTHLAARPAWWKPGLVYSFGVCYLLCMGAVPEHDTPVISARAHAGAPQTWGTWLELVHAWACRAACSIRHPRHAGRRPREVSIAVVMQARVRTLAGAAAVWWQGLPDVKD